MNSKTDAIITWPLLQHENDLTKDFSAFCSLSFLTTSPWALIFSNNSARWGSMILNPNATVQVVLHCQMPKTVGLLLYPRWLSSWKTLSILTTELPAQFWGFLNFGQHKSFFTCPWCKIRNVQNWIDFISRGAYVDARSSAFRTQNLDEEINHPLFLAFKKRCRL